MLSDKEITKANLIKVYEELPKLAEQIPEIKNEFDMERYGVYDTMIGEKIETTSCRACGCGLGNSARLFKLMPSDFGGDGFTYNLFGQRVFPALYLESTYFTTRKYAETNRLWRFLFDTAWFNYQPTFDQFIERVKYAIDMDLEIGFWDYQKKSFIKN